MEDEEESEEEEDDEDGEDEDEDMDVEEAESSALSEDGEQVVGRGGRRGAKVSLSSDGTCPRDLDI